MAVTNTVHPSINRGAPYQWDCRLAKEDLDDHSFQFCLDTIHNTLRYVAAKRKEKNASS